MKEDDEVNKLIEEIESDLDEFNKQKTVFENDLADIKKEDPFKFDNLKVIKDIRDLKERVS